MIKKLIKVFSSKLYDIAVSLAAFLSSKILKNIDKVSLLGILIVILQQFKQSNLFKIIIIFLKIIFAIMITYSIVLTFAPHFHFEIQHYEDYIKQSIYIYKHNLLEAYEVLMHGKKLKFL
jgi:uncharacterized membrane protein YesL|uniref:Uncharacterized protein n=1 Tax=Amanita muscaria TaxID=41956 RepID=A0A5Q0N4C3_AMAMU|nr:hypothetical protein [Amanita muscaria]QFZ98627.1 hypothetical protein [Amanita muscaria]